MSCNSAAEAGRLRKHGGNVWRPVPGCPCAYVVGESFRDFLEGVSPDDFRTAEVTADDEAFLIDSDADDDDEDDDDLDDDEDDEDEDDEDEFDDRAGGPPQN